MSVQNEPQNTIEFRLTELESELARVGRRVYTTWAMALLGVIGGAVVSIRPDATAQDRDDLEKRMQYVEAKTAPISVNGSDLFITGKNVYIQDGSANTRSTSGLGNLTIGYNKLRGGGDDRRTGSHNLILGDWNNYTRSSGIVGSDFNEISGLGASVLAGSRNTASGLYAVVVGGDYNTASGVLSGVLGGWGNVASGGHSTITGGFANTASGYASSISAGARSTASGEGASISGGTYNLASGMYSSITGGSSNTAGGNYSVVP